MADEQIAQKLDTLIRLQAHLAIAPLGSQKEKILFLGRVGLGSGLVDQSQKMTAAAIQIAEKKV